MLYRVLPILLLVALAACSGPGNTTNSRSGSGEYAGLGAGREAVLEESYEWLGSPYKYGGKSRSGVDCSGLVYTVYASIGVALPRTARDMFGKGTQVRKSGLRPGDLVFFSSVKNSGISHVGIYTGSGRFIHSSSSRGVIVSSLSDSYYVKHWAGGRSLLR